MAKKNSGVTDPEVLSQMENLEAAPEFKDYEEENLSLPPYWMLEKGEHVGKQFAARVIDLDNSDPDFPRFILEAMAPVECWNGPRDEAQPIHVKVGEFFTCSTYSGLPLHKYIGCRVVVTCTGTRKVNQPQPMYTFRMTMHPQDKLMVMADRKALALQKMAAFREARKNALALPAKGETVEATA